MKKIGIFMLGAVLTAMTGSWGATLEQDSIDSNSVHRIAAKVKLSDRTAPNLGTNLMMATVRIFNQAILPDGSGGVTNVDVTLSVIGTDLTTVTVITTTNVNPGVVITNTVLQGKILLVENGLVNITAQKLALVYTQQPVIVNVLPNNLNLFNLFLGPAQLANVLKFIASVEGLGPEPEANVIGWSAPTDVLSNASWFVEASLTTSSKGEKIKGKVKGIWKDGHTAFTGTLSTPKK